ncbi:uncharacterized protein LOC126796920 [Argentina anserina]|uniref:uncharacterized protein LOC126796920 n=1 Tax=Argentina anserina TaxID=57926 RepID=UPI0021766021|nr:uncharacterized protein LOC126796920 [Potentilla anserina]
MKDANTSAQFVRGPSQARNPWPVILTFTGPGILRFLSASRKLAKCKQQNCKSNPTLAAEPKLFHLRPSADCTSLSALRRLPSLSSSSPSQPLFHLRPPPSLTIVSASDSEFPTTTGSAQYAPQSQSVSQLSHISVRTRLKISIISMKSAQVTAFNFLLRSTQLTLPEQKVSMVTGSTKPSKRTIFLEIFDISQWLRDIRMRATAEKKYQIREIPELTATEIEDAMKLRASFDLDVT